MEPGSFIGALTFAGAAGALGLFLASGANGLKAFSSLGAAFRGVFVLFISKLDSLLRLMVNGLRWIWLLFVAVFSCGSEIHASGVVGCAAGAAGVHGRIRAGRRLRRPVASRRTRRQATGSAIHGVVVAGPMAEGVRMRMDSHAARAALQRSGWPRMAPQVCMCM